MHRITNKNQNSGIYPIGQWLRLIPLLVLPIFPQQFQWLTDFNGENSGHTACNFLNLPSSAHALASGMASYSGTMDATDLPRFTANSAIVDHYTFAFTHCEWLMGMRSEYLGALFPVLDVGSFGVYSQLFTPGTLHFARDIDEQPSHPSYIEYALGATYARSFFRNRLSTGAAIALVESRIENITGRTASGSIDLRYAPYSFIAGHLRISSFGMGISYSGATVESLPTQLGLSLQLSQPPDMHLMGDVLDFGMGLGVLKTADEPLHAGVNLHMQLKNYGNIRVGYEHTKNASVSTTGLSVGMGTTIGAFQINGGWRYYSKEFGPVWAISLLHNREELKRRTAEDYYAIAVKHYRKKRYFLCTFNAKRALRLDPNLWKAHALINKVKSDILRGKMREIAIVYTGNAQGVFTNPHGKGELGGFARQATIIKTLRAQFPLTICIETGNMVTADMQPLRTGFAGSYLDHIRYDAVGCGSGELQFGIAKLLKETITSPSIILSNRTSLSGGSVRHQIIEREGYRFFIASYINPDLLPEASKSLVVPFDPATLERASERCDVRILIAHDTWDHLHAFSAHLSGFDFIICGSLDQRFATPMKTGTVRVLSAGNRGKYVGNLILRFDENRHIIGIENKLFAVQEQIVPDSTIERKLSVFTATAASSEPPAGTVQKSEGTFPFISDREGKKGIYLKVTDQKAEFPLTRTIADTCDNPVYSFAAGSIVCSADADSCKRLLIMKLDGSEKRYIADNLQVRDAMFTPDGTWLYYTASPCGDTVTDLFRVKCNGGPSFPLIAWPNASERTPVFSSDGNSMVFGSNRDGTMQLYLTNPDGELPLRITDQAANHTLPAFSPDGSYIAYLSDYTNFHGRNDLWIFIRKGGIHRRITQRSNVKEFCWLSDSRTIVYTMGAMHFELTAVDIENYRYRILTPTDTVKQWDERTPQTIMFNEKEHIIYTREFTVEKERQIFRILPDGSENTRIVNSPGRDWLPMQ